MWIPASANYVAIVRAERIFNSKLAKSEKWLSDRSKAFRSGVATFPPSTESVLFAAQIDFDFMEPIWNVSVFKESKDAIEIVEVSKRIGGNIEKLMEYDALVLPNDAYLIQVDDKTLVSMAPANRQMTSRMIRSSASGRVKVSPYLTDALKFADDNADMIIAIDFDGVVSQAQIADRLRQNKTVEESSIEGYAKELSKIQGITLGVTVRDSILGSVKIDFSEAPVLIVPEAKEIFIAALKNNGIMIDDMASWTMTSDKTQIRIQGDLSATGLREIGMLVKQPLLDSFVGGYDEGGEVNAATRSKQYFSEVKSLVDRLKDKDAKSMATYAKWFDRYASEIGELPIVGVDEALLNYGADIADQFRDIAGVLDSANYERVKNRSQFQDSSYSGSYQSSRYGNRGRYGYRYDNSRNRQIASGQGNMQGGNAAKALFREIEKATAEIRRVLSQKYEIEF